MSYTCYKILSAFNFDVTAFTKLEINVNKHIANGYMPQGGVSIIKDGDNVMIAQAMIKVNE